jgi:hypothetical protein
MLPEYVTEPFQPKSYNPDEDGVTHINIYSRSRTTLGKLLSNFTHSPFEHPDYGKFQSMEGYWYWMSTGLCHDILRNLYGISAKRTGERFKDVPFKHLSKTFEDIIAEGILMKMLWNPNIGDLLKNSTLPLVHYYHESCIEDEGGRKFSEIFELIRTELNHTSTTSYPCTL